MSAHPFVLPHWTVWLGLDSDLVLGSIATVSFRATRAGCSDTSLGCSPLSVRETLVVGASDFRLAGSPPLVRQAPVATPTGTVGDGRPTDSTGRNRRNGRLISLHGRDNRNLLGSRRRGPGGQTNDLSGQARYPDQRRQVARLGSRGSVPSGSIARGRSGFGSAASRFSLLRLPLAALALAVSPRVV